jgi:arylsulfatase A-like enzyme
MDLQIGRVLQTLEATGVGHDTIVVFTSDNGGERYSDTWPFTVRKTELLEGGLRIPAVIRWKGGIPCGVVSEQVTISMDWFPTLLAAAGIAPDPDFSTRRDRSAAYLDGSGGAGSGQTLLALQIQRPAGGPRR